VRVLVADDDPVSVELLHGLLGRWGYQVEAVADGDAAWRALEAPDSPPLALIDWLMPGMDGAEVCRRLRQRCDLRPAYAILLTARDRSEDIVRGLLAGADDYVTKPFSADVLRARVQVGERVVALQMQLARRVQELQRALAHVKRLEGLLPICAYCKRVRTDHGYWQAVEAYISEHSDARFSHTICPDCYSLHIEPSLEGESPH
jgi:DNA-binding response OmpR family regulator